MPLSLPSQNHRYTDEREIPNRLATSRGLNNLSLFIKLPPRAFFPNPFKNRSNPRDNRPPLSQKPCTPDKITRRRTLAKCTTILIYS